MILIDIEKLLESISAEYIGVPPIKLFYHELAVIVAFCENAIEKVGVWHYKVDSSKVAEILKLDPSAVRKAFDKYAEVGIVKWIDGYKYTIDLQTLKYLREKVLKPDLPSKEATSYLISVAKNIEFGIIRFRISGLEYRLAKENGQNKIGQALQRA